MSEEGSNTVRNFGVLRRVDERFTGNVYEEDLLIGMTSVILMLSWNMLH